MISNCLMSCGCQAAQEIGLIVVKITQKWLSKKAVSWTDHAMTTNTRSSCLLLVTVPTTGDPEVNPVRRRQLIPSRVQLRA